MVAAIPHIDLRCSSELAHHADQRLLEQTAIGQIGDQRGEGQVEFAQLLDVKIEVLVMRVVVGVIHLHIRDAVLQQSSGQQTMLAEFARAVPLLVGRRFAADVEHVALFEQIARLRERKRVGFGVGRAASSGKPLIELLAKRVATLLGVGGRSAPARCFGQLAVVDRHARKLRAQVGGLVQFGFHVAFARRLRIRICPGSVNRPASTTWRTPLPSAENRSRHLLAAGRHFDDAAPVIFVPGVQAAHDRQAVHLLRGMRQQFTDVNPRDRTWGSRETAPRCRCSAWDPRFQAD